MLCRIVADQEGLGKAEIEVQGKAYPCSYKS